MVGDLAERRNDEELAEVGDQVASESGRVVAGTRDRGTDPQRLGAVAGRDRLRRPEDQLGVGDAEHGQDVLGRDLVAAVGDELVERAEGVAEAAVGRPGDRSDGPVVDPDRLGRGRTPEDDRDLVRGGPAEVEALAAIDDRRHHLVGLGGREDEDGVRRRLLERLQEGVPRLAGEHVSLVEDVDLPGPLRRRVADPLAEIADVVDRAVRGGVHLDHVHRAAGSDRHAGVADPARFERRPVDTVQRAGEDLGHRGLAGSARADEQIRVVDAIALDRVAEGPDDVFLPDDVGERLRAVTAIEGLLGHERSV